MKYLNSLMPHLASYGSLVGLYFTAIPWQQDRPWWHWALIAVAAILAFYTSIIDFRNAKRESRISFGRQEKVTKYMTDWVSQPGRTVIFSRDLSWGTDFDAEPALLKKARSKELLLYIQNDTQFSSKLRSEGAEIILYEGVCPEPMSRFTIVGYGKEGARIAVAAPKDGRHTIYEFGAGEHPIFSVAQDLLRTISQGKVNA